MHSMNEKKFELFLSHEKTLKLTILIFFSNPNYQTNVLRRFFAWSLKASKYTYTYVPDIGNLSSLESSFGPWAEF